MKAGKKAGDEQSLHARTGEKMRDDSREESGAMNSRYPELGAFQEKEKGSTKRFEDEGFKV